MQHPKYHLHQQVMYTSNIDDLSTIALGIIQAAMQTNDEGWQYSMDNTHLHNSHIAIEVREQDILAYLNDNGRWGTVTI